MMMCADALVKSNQQMIVAPRSFGALLLRSSGAYQLGMLPLLLPRMGAIASFCGLLPLGGYVLCAFNQEALDDCCVAAMQKES